VSRALAVLLALATPAAAADRPRLAQFHCLIGDGRAILTPRAAEEDSEDELHCEIRVTGLRPDGTAALAAELRLPGPDGRVRTVASQSLERDGREAAAEPLVPHNTWAPAIGWHAGGPRLTVELHVFFRQEGRKRWWPLFTRTLVIDHHRPRPSR
jgi:hypothetical protein